MRAVLLVGVSVQRGTPQSVNPKEYHTEVSISYKTDWSISLGFLLTNSHIYSNPQLFSVLAMWLSIFSSGADYILLRCGLGRNGKWTSSFLAFSCSHFPASTFCLVDQPIFSAWLISLLLKYKIDRIQIILLHHMKTLNKYILVCKVSFLAQPCLCAFGINFDFHRASL